MYFSNPILGGIPVVAQPLERKPYLKLIFCDNAVKVSDYPDVEHCEKIGLKLISPPAQPLLKELSVHNDSVACFTILVNEMQGCKQFA